MKGSEADRSFVMPGLAPGIHVLLSGWQDKKDVDGRDNPRRRDDGGSPGHDAVETRQGL
jgi:hypothetical protein